MEDPQTGTEGIYLKTKNEFGLDNVPIFLGPTLEQAAEEVSGEVFDETETTIQNLLAGQYLHKSKRDELLASITGEVASIRSQVKNDLDKRYSAYVDGANRAAAILSKH